MPSRQARPRLSLITTPTVLAEPQTKSLVQSLGRSVRILRQEQYRPRPLSRVDIRLVDARIGEHKAELVLDDQDALVSAEAPCAIAVE